MSQTDLPGAGHTAASRQGGGTHTVMRAAEGPLPDQPGACPYQTRHRIDSGCFQRFLIAQRRQNPRQAFGQHTFSGARRAHHQQVVSTGSGDLHGAAGLGLTPHVTEIRSKPLAGFIVSVTLGGAQRLLAPQMAHNVQRTAGRIDRQSLRHRGLGGVLCGDEQLGDPGPDRSQRHGQGAVNRTERSVQPQFPQERLMGSRLGHLALSGQNADKDRKIIQ